MTFARRLAVAEPFARAVRPQAVVVEPDGALTEIYPEEPEELTFDESAEVSPCPFNQLGHIILRGRCLMCGAAD